MPFDFGAYKDRIVELLRGVPSTGRTPEQEHFLQSSVGAGHRQHFFVDVGTSLSQRGQTIYRTIEENNLLNVRGKPGKPQCQALCTNRALSLSGSLKLDRGLTAIANHANEDVRSATEVNGAPLVLQADQIIPSIYFGDPHELLKLRVEKFGSNRNDASTAIFGAGRYNTWKIMEQGDHDKYPRVTKATVDKIADILGDEAYDIFVCDVHAGPGRGEKTFALPIGIGNLLAYVRRPIARAAEGKGDI